MHMRRDKIEDVGIWASVGSSTTANALLTSANAREDLSEYAYYPGLSQPPSDGLAVK